MEYFALSATSLLLGIIHGFDADHVIDVTDFVSQDPRPLHAIGFGARFGFGHSVTVLAFALAVYTLKSAVPVALEGFFQLLSGVLLIVLGFWGIYRRIFRPRKFLRRHKHNHGSGGNCAAGRTAVDNIFFDYGPTVTGIMTGMVGTAGVMLFGPVAAAPSVWWLTFFILLYGLGVIAAMSCYGFVASKFFGSNFFAQGKGSFPQVVTVIPSFFSIALGSVWFYRIVVGFKEAIGVIK